jgi:hypothetical protein
MAVHSATTGEIMEDEYADGKKKFVEVVKSIDPDVDTVIPVTPSRGNFLIAVSKGKARKFLSVNEDDIIDLPEDQEILKKVTGEVKNAIGELGT